MRHARAAQAAIILLTVLALVLAALLPVAAAGSVIYVDADATGANTGANWANAYTDLQTAIGAASSGQEIWVATGTYYPTNGTSRTAYFRLKNGVTIYGGFAGGETSADARDPDANVTILSGNIGDTSVSTDNTLHVVYAGGGVDSTAVLDGFTITGGHASAGYDITGGGVYAELGSPTLRYLVISGNYASQFGGGLGVLVASPTLVNVSFIGNSAGDSGGGMSVQYDAPSLTNVVFRGNSAPYGGGLYVADGSGFTVTNGTFYGNSADLGGGLFTYVSGMTLNNCIFWGNSATYYSQATYLQSTGYATMNYSLSQSQSGQSLPGGTGNIIGSDPLFMDADDGDLRLKSSSPAVDKGSNAAVPGSVATDIGGNSRFSDGNGDGTATVDIGAYEYQSGTVTNTTPTVNAVADASVNEGGTYSASVSFIDPDPDTWTATVDYGDGSATESPTISSKAFALSHTYSDNGTYTVTVTVSDGTATATDTATVTVNNVAPVVSAGADVTISAGSTFSQAGSFTDPGSDTWTATVDYGDGSGCQSLALSSKTFALSHVYSDAGTYTVTVTVTESDAEAASASDTATVTVKGLVIYVDDTATGANTGANWANAYTDLQDALSAVTPGQQIWVAAGTYTPGTARTDTFTLQNGVAIYGGFAGTEASLSQRDPNPATNGTVLSGDINDDDATTGTADNAYQVLSGTDLDSTAILDGFTVSGGNADGGEFDYQKGGGLHLTGVSSPTLANLAIGGNSATALGGGLYVYDGSPTLTNITFTGNHSGASGGGMFVYNYSAGSPTLTDVTFTGNTTDSSGAGLYMNGGSPTLTNVTFADNSAKSLGGGMFMAEGDPTVTNGLFTGNTSSGGSGGAIALSDSATMTLTNVAFADNSAGAMGNAIYIGGASGTASLTNCTLGGVGGSSAYSITVARSALEVTNSILWDGATFEIGLLMSAASADVTYSIVNGGYAGTGNLADDPRFVSASDLRLVSSSPAIAAGSNAALPADTYDLDGDGDATETIPYDLDGSSRVVQTTVDMGAYEFQWVPAGPVVTIDPANQTAVENNDATFTAHANGVPIPTVQWQVKADSTSSWADISGAASTTLVVPGVTLAMSGYQYRAVFTNDQDPYTAGTSAATLTVVPTVIYVDDTAMGANSGTSWEDAYTDLQSALGAVLSGQQIWVATGTYRPADTDRAATFGIIDGVTLYGGFAGTESDLSQRNADPATNGTILSGDLNDDDDGGATSDNSYNVVTALNTGSTTVLDGFTITGGNADDTSWTYPTFGAGLYFQGNGLTLRNLVFSGNTATYMGGALLQFGDSLTLTNVTFTGNQAPSGGALVVYGGSATLTNVVFSGNQATAGDGGAIYATAAGTLTVTNGVFGGNSASASGNAIYSDADSTALTNCTFRSLSDALSGQTVAVAGGYLTLANCIMWDNATDEISVASGATAEVSYSIVQGGYDGTGNLDDDPQFVSANDPRLQSTSPAVDSGNSAALPADSPDLDGDGDTTEALPYDLDGDSRVAGTTVDMGAYEFHVTFAVPTVVVDPSDQSVILGGTARFTASASGNPTPTVVWQVSTDSGANWTDISTATATTLTVADVALAMSGHQYRAVFTNSEGSDTSAAATLTVTKAPVVTTDPTDQTVRVGTTAAFSAAADGAPAPTALWQVSTDDGATWADISGATSTTFEATAVTLDISGYQYRAVFTNSEGTATSAAATLTVTQAPVVTSDPTDQTVLEGNSATFTAAAAGTPAPTLLWQVSSDNGASWADIATPTSSTLNVASVTLSMSGYQYRAVFTNSEGAATTAAATLTVAKAPAITSDPTDQMVAAGGTATFTATADGTPAPTVIWQASADDGTTWADVSGATSTTLTVAAVSAKMNGDQYRAVFTSAVGIATSAAATLTVTDALVAPIVTLDPTDQAALEGQSVTFRSAASGVPTPTQGWQVSADGGATWRDVTAGSATTGLGSSAGALTLANVATGMNGYQYRAVFTNTEGTATSASATLTVTDVNTAPVVDLGEDATIDEGDTFTRTGSLADPDADPWTATVDYGDAAGSVEVLALANGAFTLNHRYADNGTYTLTVTVSDGVASQSDSLQVTVNNVVPTVDPGGDVVLGDDGVLSQPGSFTDPGTDTWTATVDYGDGGGTVALTLEGNTFTLDHTYAIAGSYIVVITVTDDDGGSGSAAMLCSQAAQASVLRIFLPVFYGQP